MVRRRPGYFWREHNPNARRCRWLNLAMKKAKLKALSIPELAPFEQAELPPPASMALLAAVLSGQHLTIHADTGLGTHFTAGADTPKKAFQRALNFYREIASLHTQYLDATPLIRAVFCGLNKQDLLEKIGEAWWAKVSPKSFPASLDDFLEIVIKRKTPADCMKFLRNFYASKCPKDHEDPQAWAAGQIAELRGKGFGLDAAKEWNEREERHARNKWRELTYDYYVHKKGAISVVRSLSRKGKTKKKEEVVK